MNLFETLQRQMDFGFTGRINILKNNNGQFLGVIMLKEGAIVHAKYGPQIEHRALYSLLIKNKIDEWKYIVEPETVEIEQNDFFISNTQELLNEFKEVNLKFLKSQKLKPPSGVKLVINGDFVIHGVSINADEFDILCLISEYSNVDDIYEKSRLYEYEVTQALVKLRQKKALKVYR